MAKSFKALLSKRPPWFSHVGAGGEVILGTMARVVRNLPGHCFPGWSTEEGRKAVADILLPVILELPGNKTAAFSAELSNLSYTQRRVLLERKQISHSMAARQTGCHIVINGKQDTVFMINEEEHLVMHFFATDDNCFPVLKRAEKITAALEQKLQFATNAHGDNLTSLPTEAGCSVQLYTILHLPGLVTANMMQQVNRALEKMCLSISPFYQNLGDDAGNLFVVYTAPIPQGEEEEVAEMLEQITTALQTRECQVRNRLIQNPETTSMIPDLVNRAYGIMRYACRMEYKEFLASISMLKLGLSVGFIRPTTLSPIQFLDKLSEYMLETAPYHAEYQHRVTDSLVHSMRCIINCSILAEIELLSDFYKAAQSALTDEQ